MCINSPIDLKLILIQVIPTSSISSPALAISPPLHPPHQGNFGMSDPLRLPQRLELEIDPDLYERIEELSIRSGRSVPEIIQALISCSFPMDPAETVFREAVS